MGHGGQPCPHSLISQEWEDVDGDINAQEEDVGIETVKATVSRTTALTVAANNICSCLRRDCFQPVYPVLKPPSPLMS
ncbi:hypothetical protein AZE42_13975 [Rhizopogon vesiculosus]|uniref:Uncharacterized protein n=1 Tax=Rhizopogon vesiculosus TaxID=180088 RepID=A0A1J8Q6L9_9AGAM|nr:hypothetical protein AZE42_13975 [Rhizopogon vesiculosus]